MFRTSVLMWRVNKLTRFGRRQSKYFLRQQIFRMSQYYCGRARNCWTVALRSAHHALKNTLKGRELKKETHKNIWIMRATAAAENQGMTYGMLRNGLEETGVELNNQMLSLLSIYEPRSFQSLAEVAKRAQMEQGIDVAGMKPPEGVIVRGHLIDDLKDEFSKLK